MAKNIEISCEKLNAELISSALSAHGVQVCVLDTVDSTNSEARRRIETGDTCPLLIASDSQTDGRGRMGRSFYSPSSTGLYMSLVLRARESSSDTVRLTTAAASSVALSIEELCGISTEIKWVNDVYLHGKKICGILCESFSASGVRYAVIGIGINLHTKDFPEELRGKACSLEPSEDIKNELAVRITATLLRFWENISAPDIMEYYRAYSMVLGKRVVFWEDGAELYGIAESIDGQGHLCVRLDDGSQKMLSSGEISLRLADGKFI